MCHSYTINTYACIDEETEEMNEDLEEYREQVAEIDAEEFPDEEDEEEEESEPDATDRIRTSFTEKHEETNDAISNLQVCKPIYHNFLPFLSSPN